MLSNDRYWPIAAGQLVMFLLHKAPPSAGFFIAGIRKLHSQNVASTTSTSNRTSLPLGAIASDKHNMNDAESMSNVLIQISKQALWAPAAVFFFHSMASRSLGHEPYVDPVAHFFGGIAIAFFFWKSANCCQYYLGSLPLITHALLAFGLATFTAVAWEFMEFFMFVFTYGETSAQQWRATMMRDLFLGISGAALFLGVNIKIKQRRNRGK